MLECKQGNVNGQWTRDRRTAGRRQQITLSTSCSCELKSPENCVIPEIHLVQSRNFAKNQWSLTKLTLDLQFMLIDLHAKNQVNIYKRLEKKSGKLCDH